MKSILSIALALGIAVGAIAKPLASVHKFDGKFLWVKIGALSPPTAASLANAKSIEIEVMFYQAVKVKKDARGNAWFSLIVADQGSDWKWHQTTGNGGIAVKGGVIKAGGYVVLVPLAGIPREVLKGKQQSLSIGPACSGLSGTATFTIDAIHGK